MNDETQSNSDNNKWAGGVHVAAFLVALFTSWSAGIGGMVAAFIVWIAKKDDSAFIRAHAAEAFNFNFSMFLYSVIALFFALMTFGLGLFIVIPFAVVVAIVWLYCTIKAASAGFNGLAYSYPFSIKLLT